MADTTRLRRIMVFLPHIAVAVELDEMQFAGPCLICWKGNQCIAQFTGWLGWAEEGSMSGTQKQEPKLASVTSLRPPDSAQNGPKVDPGEA